MVYNMNGNEDDDNLLSDHSCSEEAAYSDHIDTDIEAELYGLIHHDTQDNPVSLQDKTDCVENNSVPHENLSDSAKNNSLSLGPSECSSVLSERNTNSTKKLKKSAKKNKKYNDFTRTINTDFFCSDTVVDNLFTSFESPIKNLKPQSSQVQSENSEINIIEKPAKQKSNMVTKNENLKRKLNQKSPKRKSVLVSEVLENIQAKRNKNSNSTQTKNSVSKERKNNYDCDFAPEEDSFVIIDESSDTDSSIIFFEPDQSELKTNLTQDTVVLSSDSEVSDSSLERDLFEACQQKQALISNAAISSNQDVWQINSDDLFRSNRQSNRYHENALVTCSNCHLKGHSSKFCSVPKAVKCFFCGNLHSGAACKNKICMKCFQLGHDYRRCYIRYIETCQLCRMRGHSDQNCPDLWRRYHLTTSKGSIVKGNPNPHSPLYCYNCGLKGHYGAECMEIHIGRWNLPTWTSVISYSNPYPAVQKEERKNAEISKSSKYPWWIHRKGPNEAFSNNALTPNAKRKKKKKVHSASPAERRKNSSASPAERRKISSASPVERRKKSRASPNNYQPPTVLNSQNNYYFPRTPKATPIPSISNEPRRFPKRFKKKGKEHNLLTRQKLHQMGLQQRLGLPFSSTI